MRLLPVSATHSEEALLVAVREREPATFALENCVHKLVGDRVVLAARAYFACDTLNGGELENQLGASLGDILGAALKARSDKPQG